MFMRRIVGFYGQIPLGARSEVICFILYMAWLHRRFPTPSCEKVEILRRLIGFCGKYRYALGFWLFVSSYKCLGCTGASSRRVVTKTKSRYALCSWVFCFMSKMAWLRRRFLTTSCDEVSLSRFRRSVGWSPPCPIPFFESSISQEFQGIFRTLGGEPASCPSPFSHFH